MGRPEDKLTERNAIWCAVRLRIHELPADKVPYLNKPPTSILPTTEESQRVIFETTEEIKMTPEENKEFEEYVADSNKGKESERGNLMAFILELLKKRSPSSLPAEEKEQQTQEPGTDSEQSSPEETKNEDTEKQYP